MSSSIVSIKPDIFLLHLEKKICQGCKIKSLFVESRQEAREKDKTLNEGYSENISVEKAYTRTTDKPIKIFGRNLYYFEAFIQHKDDVKECYTYKLLDDYKIVKREKQAQGFWLGEI